MTFKKLFAFGYVSFVLGLLFLPVIASAAMPGIPYWGGNGIVSCTGLGKSDATHNSSGGSDGKACTSLCDLVQTIENILSFGETVALFIATPIFFAWGGIVILTAGANPGQIEQGKKIFTGTLIGVLITLGAYLIVATVVKTLSAVGVGGFSGTGICGT